MKYLKFYAALYFCGCIFFVFVTPSSSFNLEERLPIVKFGTPKSLFGLSVAEHHVLPGTQDGNDAVLLVGAPTADAQSYHSSDSYKPGALFKCSVSAQTDDCQSVLIDDSENSLEANNSNQWLGVTVKTQKPGGKVVVCAHRYTIRGGGPKRGVIWAAQVGRCYMLSSELRPVEYRPQWTPCIGKLDPFGAYSHNWYGVCQAGTSVAFANNEDEDLVFGMPGPFDWTGAINSNELSDKVFFQSNLWSKEDAAQGIIPQNAYLGMVHSVRTAFDPWYSGAVSAWIPETPLRLGGLPVSANSYLGFSLTTGNIAGPYINFVTGAPRANDTGVVVIFEKAQRDVEKVLQMREILHGERLASAFGYDVKVVDITGDDRVDLIVGAPQYYDKEEKHGGAVYIYVNKGLDKIGPTPTKILYGDVDSSFGSSITDLGDINMDGANDIAIGSPGYDGGKGAVYIFHGNSDPDVGVDEEPTQVLRAVDLITAGHIHSNMTGLGYSLSGGLDMDFNGYPDLLVGSLGDTAVLFRTRPIINVQASLTSSVKKIALNPSGNSHVVKYTNPSSGKTYDLVTYNISVCMNYTSSPSSFDEAVEMEYTVMLDYERQSNDLLPRVTFAPLDYGQGSKTGVLRLFPQSSSRTSCTVLTVYLGQDIQDKLSPFKMSLSYNIPTSEMPVETPQSGLVSLSKFPVLNEAVKKDAYAQVDISKDCGLDDICRSNLKMSAHYEVLFDGNPQWQKLGVGTDDIPLLLVGTEKQIGLKINIANPLGEDAHQAKLTIYLPPFLQYIGLTNISPVGAIVSCTLHPHNSSAVLCNLGNPFRTNSSLSMIVKLENDERLYTVNGFAIKTQISTSSTQPGIEALHQYSVSVRVQAQVKIEGYSTRDQVRFGGHVIGESAVKRPEDAGLYVGHSYEIQNTGTSEVDDVYVNISWPQLIANGKWLFYLVQVEISGPGVSNRTKCNTPKTLMNPLNLNYDSPSTSTNRKRRQSGDPIEEPETEQVSNDRPASFTEILKCPDSAKCVNFSCSLGSLLAQKNIFIDLKAVVWNSTFLEEYYGVADVIVYSSASVAVDRGNVLYAESSILSSQVSTKVLAEQVIPPDQEVTWWIIALATLAGVILLVIIVLVLWRCGFFKRRRDFGDYHKARRHKQASKKADEVSDQMLY